MWLALAVLAVVVVLMVYLHKSAPTSIEVGRMVGCEGIAQDTFSRQGMVFVRGELWRATAARGIIRKGERVKVTEVRPGLLVVVERSDAP